MKKTIITSEKSVTLDGLMTLGKLETGEHTLDFMCCEDVAMEPFTGNFRVQGMRDGNIYMQQKRKRVRNNVLLIRKAKHGRLSATRDHAYQLTLKVFGSEGIDWKRAFVEETIEVMTEVVGSQRMREMLTDMLVWVDRKACREEKCIVRPFGMEW